MCVCLFVWLSACVNEWVSESQRYICLNNKLRENETLFKFVSFLFYGFLLCCCFTCGENCHKKQNCSKSQNSAHGFWQSWPAQFTIKVVYIYIPILKVYTIKIKRKKRLTLFVLGSPFTSFYADIYDFILLSNDIIITIVISENRFLCQ